jgi:hypothetical protein
MTKLASATLKGVAPYSPNKAFKIDKLNKELPEAYEERTWRERLHYDDDGQVFIPPMAFKNCMAEIAKYLSVQIPGKGKSTYTKHFEAGILVVDNPYLGIHRDDVAGDWVFVPSDGVTGSGKRVHKKFPIIPAPWQTTVQFIVMDDIITKDVFKQHLDQAGQLIGVGRFRPRNRGVYGRFLVESFDWAEG